MLRERRTLDQAVATTQMQQTWFEILRAVRDRVGPDAFRSWLQPTRLDSIEQGLATADHGEAPSAITFANQETLLIERVKLWAEAWSNKDFAAYTDFYSSSHRAGFQTRADWVAHRRSRILRPGQIRVDVSRIQIRWRSDNRAIIDFRQDFESSNYSDRVRKRLGFERVGSQWKITEERVLSVL